MVDFIITGLPKCGKTLLTHTLNLLDGFTVFGEILIGRKGAGNMPPHPHQLMEDMRQRNKENNFLSWYNKEHSSIHDNVLDIYKPWDVDNFLDLIFSQNENSGFKIHHHHFQEIPHAILYMTRKDVSIIHLTRENPVKQAIATLGNRFRGKQFHCKPASIISVINDFKQRSRELREWFADSHYMGYSYEDLTGGGGEVGSIDLRPFSNFLDVKMPEFHAVHVLKNTQFKVSDNVTNYQELWDALPEYREYMD